MRKTLITLASIVLLVFSVSACGGDTSPEQTDAAHDEEAHEHGPGSHTHEIAGDTAGTYVDTTGAFFSGEDTSDAGHDHGADSHTH